VEHAENAFDPKQARDARGRWTESTAIKAGREAHAKSGHAIAEPSPAAHRQAELAHKDAREQHEAMAVRHAELGNRRAAKLFAQTAAQHRERAEGHRGTVLEQGQERARRGRLADARARGARKGWERRREDEDLVLGEIPSHLQPLYQRTKGAAWLRGLKGERKATRFLEYAEAHKREAMHALEAHSEAQTAKLVAELEALNERRARELEEERSELELELDEEREALKENPMKRTRAVNVAPELNPAAYGRTYVAELVSGAAAELQKVADEMRAGADPRTLRARLDANITTLQAVSAGLRRAGRGMKQNPDPPSFKAAHWGLEPSKIDRMNVPDPRENRAKGLFALGPLYKVTYLTKKGSDTALVEYEHKFGRRMPVLAYGSKDGKLYVVDGSYKIRARGIVG